MIRNLGWMLAVWLLGAQAAQAASVNYRAVTLQAAATNAGYSNDADNLVFFQAINPASPGFASEANGQWAFLSDSGAALSDVSAVGLQFNGPPALLGIPAESGTLTIGAGNEIADLWTERKYARPVVFVSLEDPNLNNGVSILPTAPITSGSQFLFDVRQAEGFDADLTGAKVHYLVAEEGWHRLSDGRMLLISSAEVSHTGFAGQTIELGGSFTGAVTIAQLQRSMLFKGSLGFRQLYPMEVYQGAAVTSGVGDFDSIGLRLMQQSDVEAANGDTIYGGRVAFMVLGHLTAMENEFHYVRDSSTNIRGGSYLTVPSSNFKNFSHGAATSPLLNKAACAEDDDVQNFCAYLTMPVDMFSRSTFKTPRIPYMDANFQPLRMQRTLYSEHENWDWEKVLEADIVSPTVDEDGKPVEGVLAQMHPNFVADRGWDHVLIGSDSHWHWFATYHYNTCTFDSVKTPCTDYVPGNGIIDGHDIQWDASIAYYHLIEESGWGHLPKVEMDQEIFISHDFALRDSNFFAESINAPKWAASQTANYLYQDSLPTERHYFETGYYGKKAFFYNAFDAAPTAQPWQLHAANLVAYATEFYCSTCESPIPDDLLEFFNLPTTGNFETTDKAMLRMPFTYSEYASKDEAYRWVKPAVGQVTERLRTGDYLFANVLWNFNATDFRWVRSATGSIDDAVTIATDQFGYQVTLADAGQYVTMCFTYSNVERCGKWFKAGKWPTVTDLNITPEPGTQAPIEGYGLIANYTFVPADSGTYDKESGSLLQWQQRVGDSWENIVGDTVNDLAFDEAVNVGDEIRFCVTPRSLQGDTGLQRCSPSVVILADQDGDGIPNAWDPDDDNDNWIDSEDAFPLDGSEWIDTDFDGIGNNSDDDDDNDGLSDADENSAGSDPLDPDSDGDGTLDGDDPRPTVYGDLPDFDDDGIADELDLDRDGDGVLDFLYAVEDKAGLQTSLEEGDILVLTRRWDDNPYKACTAHHITVTSNADSGAGSLRQAMEDLCASDPYGSLNSIDFSGPMTIALESPLVVTKGMKINGDRQVVIDGQNQTGLFNVKMTDRLVGNDFPHLVGLTLRNGLTVTSPMEQGSQTSASAIQMNTGGFVFIDFTLMENMTAPVVGGDNYLLYANNSMIANVTGGEAALVNSNGQIALFSSTLYNSEGGAISLSGMSSAQLRNSLLLKGPNGSTVCDVDTWEQQTASWVEGNECGIDSEGAVILADPANGDYRPIPGSANIDAGTADYEGPAGDADLLGNDRVMGEYNPDHPPEEGGPLYPRIDIGAIEYDFYGDFDGDGVADQEDDLPTDASETVDTDKDGVGDNSDAFPEDPSESADSDNDGVGDNADAFPLDATETVDSDGDGVGDNSDAFIDDPDEWLDTDGDGVGNNADDDDDNDGIPDAEDPTPLGANPSTGPSRSGSSGGGGSADPLWLMLLLLPLARKRRQWPGQ